MPKIYCIIVPLLLLASNGVAQPVNNIAVSSIVTPQSTVHLPLGQSTVIKAQFQNTGTNDQSNVKVRFIITNDGTVVYRDSAIVNDWMSGEYREITFRKFNPTSKTSYEFCAIAELGFDEVSSDDMACVTNDVRYLNDIRALSVTFPLDTSFMPGSEIRVKGRFTNQGVSDRSEIRMRVQIKRCADGALVFQADSIPGILELNVDSIVEFRFHGRQGNFDTRNLLPGCYNVAAIALLSDDVDRTNDTAFSTFTILPFNNNVRDNNREESLSCRNFPNPASTSSTIDFTIPTPGLVSLRLLDMSGRIYQGMTARHFQAGSHSQHFDLRELPDGMYLYELTFFNTIGTIQRVSKTMVIAK